MADRFNHLLKSLCPVTDEDWGALRSLFGFAEAFVHAPETDLAIVAQRAESGTELASFFECLSEESKHYFFGLVEALEIYGNVPSLESFSPVSLGRRAIDEIRQLRDHCLAGVVSPIFDLT